MTYGLVAIVRNEAETIVPLLESVRPLISSWAIVDTGSTDGTPHVIRRELAGIPGRLRRRKWVDFGKNRSEAFRLARGLADWLILADADMTWSIDPAFEPDPAVDAYMISMGNGAGFEWRLPLLVRGDLPWRSVGAVHEYTSLPDRAYVGVPTDLVTITYCDRSGPEKTAMHLELLEAQHARNPDDERTVFYLAQTLRESGRLDEARDMYRQRVRMGGFAEEAFYAAFQVAMLTPFPHSIHELMFASNMRPTRLEPLHALVQQLNAHGLHDLAWRLSSVPGPLPADVLFVHRDVWEWGMLFERSIAAWHVGEWAEFAALTSALLERDLPEHVRAQVEANAALPRAA